ncbi:unnamed protein product [Oncorhynchus mykiss]|uniref:Uncharacterized protein n=1 Tax=Oncorhynchus mykiss TaxID=8022 RepID=A0A060WIM7_ONCMY|nr:unnamed protein product [Oncorhynchus mykiss]
MTRHHLQTRVYKKRSLPGGHLGLPKFILAAKKSLSATCPLTDIDDVPISRQLRRCPGNHCLTVWREDVCLASMVNNPSQTTES